MTPAILPLDEAREYWFDEGCFITEFSNSATDPALSIARARVPAGQATQWHRLAGITERYVILNGQGTVEIADLPPQGVAPGDTVVIPPLCRQRILASGAEDLIFLALCTPRFVPDAYENMETLSA